MTSTIILTISVILQFIAAFLSLRLIKITGRWQAWGFIAAAMILMGVRRSIILYRVLIGDITLPPDLAAELVALSISALMVAAVICIGVPWIEVQKPESEMVWFIQAAPGAIRNSTNLTFATPGK